ncbi:hypothetical protein NQZ68_019150 [Dissostichus eleginoides]|nr:hypothetical protein NQZ68_019150 [Dissostichus eleginoides]
MNSLGLDWREAVGGGGVCVDAGGGQWSRLEREQETGHETVSGAGRARIQARGLDGVRTELTPQPSKIHKWTQALDGTGLESETCSRLTTAGVNLQQTRV